jgi:hypothetical protein
VGRLDKAIQASTRFPDILDALAHHVLSHATQLYHEEMGNNGNYQMMCCYDSSTVLSDDDTPAATTLTLVADVPEVHEATLDLSRFTAHLDHAELDATPLCLPHAHNRPNTPITCRQSRGSRA